MEPLPGIVIDGTALYLAQQKTLILADLHVGYEEERRRRGVLLPKGKQERLTEELARLFAAHEIGEVVLAGDVKHEFGRISAEEWHDVQDLITLIRSRGASVTVVGGNHDVMIAPILKRLDVPLVAAKIVMNSRNRKDGAGPTLIVHGDRTFGELEREGAVTKEDLRTIKTVIMGHEHPALAITDGVRTETVKCFLEGERKIGRRKARLVVMPSSNPLVAGTDVLRERPLGPLLDSFDGLSAFALLDERVLAFGRVELLRRRER